MIWKSAKSRAKKVFKGVALYIIRIIPAFLVWFVPAYKQSIPPENVFLVTCVLVAIMHFGIKFCESSLEKDCKEKVERMFEKSMRVFLQTSGLPDPEKHLRINVMLLKLRPSRFKISVKNDIYQIFCKPYWVLSKYPKIENPKLAGYKLSKDKGWIGKAYDLQATSNKRHVEVDVFPTETKARQAYFQNLKMDDNEIGDVSDVWAIATGFMFHEGEKIPFGALNVDALSESGAQFLSKVNVYPDKANEQNDRIQGKVTLTAEQDKIQLLVSHATEVFS